MDQKQFEIIPVLEGDQLLKEAGELIERYIHDEYHESIEDFEINSLKERIDLYLARQLHSLLGKISPDDAETFDERKPA